MGITSFVFSILAMFLGIIVFRSFLLLFVLTIALLAIIFGTIAVTRKKNIEKNKYYSFAVLGLIFGFIKFVLSLLYLLFSQGNLHNTFALLGSLFSVIGLILSIIAIPFVIFSKIEQSSKIIVFGLTLLIAGILSLIYGININNNLVHQLNSLFSSGSTNPGTTYIILGVTGIIIGIIMVIVGILKQKQSEYNNISKTDYSYSNKYSIDDNELRSIFLADHNIAKISSINNNKDKTKCQKCGKENSGGYSACPYCGSNALVSPSDYNSATKTESIIQMEANLKGDTEVQPNNRLNVDNKKDNNHKNDYFVGKNWKDILIENNLNEYYDLFEKNKLIDLSSISELNENDLEKLGITIMGDRKRINKLIHGIKNNYDK